jgi:2-oxoglutarate/2-oxoacid ferredoxin oxidoreductase subunit beta
LIHNAKTIDLRHQAGAGDGKIRRCGERTMEVLSACPTQYGRRNRIEGPEKMIRDLIERCILEEEAKGLTEQERAEKIMTGEFLSWER